MFKRLLFGVAVGAMLIACTPASPSATAAPPVVAPTEAAPSQAAPSEAAPSVAPSDALPSESPAAS